jgi:hypothetical protein
MEYVAGVSLAQKIAAGPMAEDEVIRLLYKSRTACKRPMSKALFTAI